MNAVELVKCPRFPKGVFHPASTCAVGRAGRMRVVGVMVSICTLSGRTYTVEEEAAGRRQERDTVEVPLRGLELVQGRPSLPLQVQQVLVAVPVVRPRRSSSIHTQFPLVPTQEDIGIYPSSKPNLLCTLLQARKVHQAAPAELDAQPGVVEAVESWVELVPVTWGMEEHTRLPGHKQRQAGRHMLVVVHTAVLPAVRPQTSSLVEAGASITI